MMVLGDFLNTENKRRCIIFGATGRTGRQIAEYFTAMGWQVIAVGRDRAKLENLDLEYAILDFNNGAFADGENPIRPGDVVVLSAGVRFVPKIVKLCPPTVGRFVVVGSARYLSAYPGAGGIAMREAIEMLPTTGLDWVLLAPTMIYGAAGENNIMRMAGLIKRFAIVPLPQGGKTLLQPIHTSDVVKSVAAAATANGVSGKVINLAGPKAITNRELLENIALAMGRKVTVIGLPKWLMHLLAFFTRITPGIPSISYEEVERLVEDRTVSTDNMKNLLGIRPMGLKEGLKETFIGYDKATD